jgi:hypothetical protein
MVLIDNNSLWKELGFNGKYNINVIMENQLCQSPKSRSSLIVFGLIVFGMVVVVIF